MNRQHLISDTQIALIRSELQHLKMYSVITPDTDASYANLFRILNEIAGA